MGGCGNVCWGKRGVAGLTELAKASVFRTISVKPSVLSICFKLQDPRIFFNCGLPLDE